MEIIRSSNANNGTRGAVIVGDKIPACGTLFRIIRRIPEATVSRKGYRRFYPEQKATITFKDISIVVSLVWADYHLDCTTDSPAFDEFLDILEYYRMKWWERFF